MSENNWHICSFFGTVARLKPAERKDRMRVLAALANDPKISTWDMDSAMLRKTIMGLIEDGLLTNEPEPYPWHRFVITAAGADLLAAEAEKARS